MKQLSSPVTTHHPRWQMRADYPADQVTSHA
jgi:hypothetical protein